MMGEDEVVVLKRFCRRQATVGFMATAWGVLAVLTPTGCTWMGPAGAGRSVTVVVPAVHPDYRSEPSEWRITWWDGARVTHTDVRQIAPFTVDLPLDRHGAEVVAVKAVGHITVAGRILALQPVGGWAAAPASTVSLGSEVGSLMEVVLDVAERGLDPALVNLARLADTVIQEVGDSPAALDRSRLLAALGSGDVSRYDIRRRDRPVCVVKVIDEHEGLPWLGDEPETGMRRGVAAGVYRHWTVPVANGEVRRWWRRAPREEVLTVGRDLRGHAFWYISGGQVEDAAE